jgi:hypothetical protein
MNLIRTKQNRQAHCDAVLANGNTAKKGRFDRIRLRAGVRNAIMVGIAVVSLTLVFPTSRKALAQSPGVNLADLVARVVKLEASVKSILDQLAHITLTPGPAGPAGATGPVGGLGFNRCPTIIYNPLPFDGTMAPFPIPSNPAFNLWVTNPVSHPFGGVKVMLPPSGSVQPGYILVVKNEGPTIPFGYSNGPTYSTSAYLTRVVPPPGETIDASFSEVNDLEYALVFYSTGTHWNLLNNVSRFLPPPPDNNGG